MKPNEDMHGSMEEVELDPCDLYVSLGTLIVEGRLPGLTERGYGGGPHCLPPHGQNRHECDLNSELCQRQAVLLKHMLLLWKNGIPMSIEVILHPDCCKLENFESLNIEASSNTDTSSVLLEQWNVHMLPKKVPDANTTSRGLILAVLSFLYFSQLSAWLNLPGGKFPQNVQYRICVPGEAFSNKFSKPPEMHVFPLANVGRNNAMKVTVRTLPRDVHITLHCKVHERQNTEEHNNTGTFHKRKVGNKEDEMVSEYDKKKFISRDQRSRIDKYYKGKADRLFEKVLSQTSSPADSMLGDSLLDPPQSLQMYPKRYQSPSRSGSPSIEAPERLMLGPSFCKKGYEKQKCDYRRPQRRPVVERFLKNEFGRVSSGSLLKYQERSLDYVKSESVKQKMSSLTKASEMSSYYCDASLTPILPNQEMQFVLERLRHQFPCNKHTSKFSDLYHTNSVQYKDNFYLNIPEKKNLPQSFKSSYPEPNQKQEYSSDIPSIKNEVSKDPDQELQYIVSAFSNLHLEPIIKNETVSPNTKEISFLQTCDNCLLNCETKQFCDISEALKAKKEIASEAYEMVEKGSQTMFYFQHDQESLETENSTNGFSWASSEILSTSEAIGENLGVQENESDTSIKTKCDKNDNEWQDTRNKKLPHCKTWSEGLSQLRAKACLVKRNRLLKQILPGNQNGSSLCVPENQKEVRASGDSRIPSAEAKAKFRRSLDSATSLVFYKSSGLPLTSSPAPIRKSGTCFDFDSSLTSVSAIKRALFEKNPEEDDQSNFLSISAPPSTTTSSLLCNFEESVLNGCLEPVSTVEGFTAEIGASGSFCPRHKTFPVTVFFYTLEEVDKVVSPYLTLFNPHRTVVKMFVVRYNLSDMPPNCQTFLRQRTLYMPVGASQNDLEARKWLRYLIHLRFASSKSGRIYLHTDVRLIIFRKSDVDAATIHGDKPYELRSFIQEPLNPKFSPQK
ncbi:atos homolog protein A-like isoform X2 [Tachypleus tridentatus]|uniref:atos homolog protein A-like isoform X2 n=1 Tax=Tachypleus tridentatus TaxID=6853 RepID=UPI003FD552E2